MKKVIGVFEQCHSYLNDIAVEAEAFIAAVIRERFDYTKWQRTYFDAKSPESIREEALAFAKNHPFTGNATRI